MRTNNVQERASAEIKRRSKVVPVFPSVESLVRLVGAVCLDQNDTWPCAEPHGRPRPAEGLRIARAAGGGGRGRRARPDARGGGLHGQAQ